MSGSSTPDLNQMADKARQAEVAEAAQRQEDEARHQQALQEELELGAGAVTLRLRDVLTSTQLSHPDKLARFEDGKRALAGNAGSAPVPTPTASALRPEEQAVLDAFRSNRLTQLPSGAFVDSQHDALEAQYAAAQQQAAQMGTGATKADGTSAGSDQTQASVSEPQELKERASGWLDKVFGKKKE